MAYRLQHCTDVSGEIRRVVEEQIDRGTSEIDSPDIDGATALHQVRKRCKKIRAVLRLARGPLDRDGAYAAENAWYRDLARELSTLRDADVLIETHDDLVEAIKDPDIYRQCAAIRERLVERRERLAEHVAAPDERLRTARRSLLEGRDRVHDWASRVQGFKALEPGFRRTYRRGRRAMDAAYRSTAPEDFHEWRKRVKYHWYACRLLRGIWPAVMDARCGELRALSELLGDEHDLSVYSRTLETEPDVVEGTARVSDILAAVDQRRTRLRRQAQPLAMRLYTEKPGRISNRFAGYWRAWRLEDD
ncbi:MAG: CHAD domain-containing protein [Gammaproteobacteria bacterium]|nr:CHAD domain-containing protein [Gammaproteobacteria bacterium]